MSSAGHEAETRIIQKVIKEEEIRLRDRYPVLQYQTQIGFGLWLGSIAWFAGNAYAYGSGWISGWLALPLAALPLSLLHEIEHDLIHKQYFGSNKLMQDVMLFFIWILKAGHEMSPYARRTLHLHHHNQAGQLDDIEERLIGLGIKSNMFRIATAVYPPLGIIIAYAPKWGIYETTGWSLIPGGGLFTKEKWEFYFTLLLVNLPLLFGYLSFSGYNWATFLLLTWIGPNVLRHACLVLMSSYSHYYNAEDAKSPGDVFLQNQILNHWCLVPFQMFCFNFGAEHIIHHYVVHQPFYIRHLCRYKAWKVMAENGVRVNDFAMVQRANRRE